MSAAQAWRELRLSRGLSLREMERRTGIHRGRLSVIERGLQPSPAEAARMLAVLAQDPEEELAEDRALPIYGPAR